MDTGSIFSSLPHWSTQPVTGLKLGGPACAAIPCWGKLKFGDLLAVLRIRIRIHMFLGLPDPDPHPLVRGMGPDPALDPDPESENLNMV